MSSSPDMCALSREEPSGVRRSLSRLSIAGTLRRKTSRLLGRHGPSVSEPAVNLPPATDAQPSPLLKTKRSWLNSVGAHFYRHHEDNRAAALEPSTRGSSSQDAVVVEVHEHEQEHEEEGGSTATPSTPPWDNLNSPHRRSSPSHRFMFGHRAFRLHSLPARFRRRGVALFGGRSSSSSGGPIEEKENAPMLGVPVVASRPANPGSWSSFRLGVQKAVREMVDGNFRFSDDHGLRNTAPTRPPPRVPLRTLWTIQSADCSEDHDSADTPALEGGFSKPQPKPWSPDWSRSSRNLKLMVTPPSNSHVSDDNATAVKNDDIHPDADADLDANPCPPPASSPLSSPYPSSPSSASTATCTTSSPASSAFVPSPVSPAPAPAPTATTIQNWDRNLDRAPEHGAIVTASTSAPPTLRGGRPPIGQGMSLLPPTTTMTTATGLPLEESMPTMLQVLREVQNRPERVLQQHERQQRVERSGSRGENVAAGGGVGSAGGGGGGASGSGNVDLSRREDIRPVAVVM